MLTKAICNIQRRSNSQYSAATARQPATRSSKSWRQSAINRVCASRHRTFEDDVYIEEIARSLIESLTQIDFEPEVIVMSYHGMPLEARINGDRYYLQCKKTTELLGQQLGLPCDRLIMTFQSRFGRAKWLKPYTDETIKDLALSGTKRIAVVTPGFSADCLETIEEIGSENAEYFFAAGGDAFVRIDCLNDSDGGMRVIESIVRRELCGWI